MPTIGLDQYSSNRALYEHRCLKKSGRYENMLVTVVSNSIINLFLKQQWFPPLNNSLEKIIVT